MTGEQMVAVARELAAARKSKRLPWLRPDGKSQVTVEYSRGVPQRVIEQADVQRVDGAFDEQVIDIR